jgi:hypothetical protein
MDDGTFLLQFHLALGIGRRQIHDVLLRQGLGRPVCPPCWPIAKLEDESSKSSHEGGGISQRGQVTQHLDKGLQITLLGKAYGRDELIVGDDDPIGKIGRMVGLYMYSPRLARYGYRRPLRDL